MKTSPAHASQARKYSSSNSNSNCNSNSNSTPQHSTAQHSTSNKQHNTAQNSAAHHISAHHCTVQQHTSTAIRLQYYGITANNDKSAAHLIEMYHTAEVAIKSAPSSGAGVFVARIADYCDQPPAWQPGQLQQETYLQQDHVEVHQLIMKH